LETLRTDQDAVSGLPPLTMNRESKSRDVFRRELEKDSLSGELLISQDYFYSKLVSIVALL